MADPTSTLDEYKIARRQVIAALAMESVAREQSQQLYNHMAAEVPPERVLELLWSRVALSTRAVEFCLCYLDLFIGPRALGAEVIASTGESSDARAMRFAYFKSLAEHHMGPDSQLFRDVDAYLVRNEYKGDAHHMAIGFPQPWSRAARTPFPAGDIGKPELTPIRLPRNNLVWKRVGGEMEGNIQTYIEIACRLRGEYVENTEAPAPCKLRWKTPDAQ